MVLQPHKNPKANSTATTDEVNEEKEAEEK
jgi:hypothetical protein